METGTRFGKFISSMTDVGLPFFTGKTRGCLPHVGSKDQAHDTEKLHVILFGEGNIEPDKVRKTKVKGICISAACIRQCVHASFINKLFDTKLQYRHNSTS